MSSESVGIVSAGDIGVFRGGSGFPVLFQGQKSGELPFFKVSDMNRPGNELFMVRANNYVSEDVRASMGATRIPAGAIVFAKVGAAVYLERKRILAHDSCIDNNMAAFIVDNSRFDVRFLHYLLSAFKLSSLVATTALPSLNGTQLRSIPLLMPSALAEQREIARSLSSVDMLISSIERLIEKKRAIKQGMMQQLLTGKTRLPGFSAKWVDGRLADVLKVRHGRSQREVESPTGKYPILGTGGVIGWTDTPLYSRPSVLIGRKGTIDRPQYRDTPFWTVDTLFFTEVYASADPLFLYFVFTTVDWRSMNEASGVPSLNSSRVESVEIRIPPPDEQRAIASVLRDCEREVEALQDMHAQYISVKQGMMQELLTGRTRLTPTEVPA